MVALKKRLPGGAIGINNCPRTATTADDAIESDLAAKSGRAARQGKFHFRIGLRAKSPRVFVAAAGEHAALHVAISLRWPSDSHAPNEAASALAR